MRIAHIAHSLWVYTGSALASSSRYMLFPCSQKACFMASQSWGPSWGCYVLSQHGGVPMGGKLCSQLSSLFLMCKEMHNTHISLFGSAVFHTRYKHNIYVSGLPGTVFPFMLLWCDALSTLYTIPVQVEGYGSAMDVLESTICVTNNGVSMTVRCKTLELSERPDPCSLNCRSVMKSLVHLPPHGGLLIGGPGNGAPPLSKSSPYAIIYDSRAETKHTSKVYDAAPLKDRLGELIHVVIFVLIHHGCFAKLGPLQDFNFFSSIH